jgi:hypothetical protein
MVCSSRLAFCAQAFVSTLAFGFVRGKRTVKAGWLFRRVLLKSLQIPGYRNLKLDRKFSVAPMMDIADYAESTAQKANVYRTNR